MKRAMQGPQARKVPPGLRELPVRKVPRVRSVGQPALRVHSVRRASKATKAPKASKGNKAPGAKPVAFSKALWAKGI